MPTTPTHRRVLTLARGSNIEIGEVMFTPTMSVRAHPYEGGARNRHRREHQRAHQDPSARSDGVRPVWEEVSPRDASAASGYVHEDKPPGS